MDLTTIEELLKNNLIWAVGAIFSLLYIKKMFERTIEEAKRDLREEREYSRKEREQAKLEREKSMEVLNSYAGAINSLSQKVDGVVDRVGSIEELTSEAINKIDRILPKT